LSPGAEAPKLNNKMAAMDLNSKTKWRRNKNVEIFEGSRFGFRLA